MPASAKQSNTKRPWAALIPYIPPYGNRTTQRMQVFPRFITTSFQRLANQHRAQGSSMLPCAIEYFQPSTRNLPLGRHVGFTGAALERLTRARRGMPTYVWPTKPTVEHDLLRAGLTALTDHADPGLTWLPSGHARWRQPGCGLCWMKNGMPWRAPPKRIIVNESQNWNRKPHCGASAIVLDEPSSLLSGGSAGGGRLPPRICLNDLEEPHRRVRHLE